MNPTHKGFVDYLEQQLIPDLKRSGSFRTAEDFEECVRIIKEQAEENEQLRRSKDSL